MNLESHDNDQLAAYALNTLDAAEAAEVESHLADCASCQQALGAYQEVAGLLALTAPGATPPPALKKRLLAEIARDAAAAPIPADTATAGKSAGPTSTRRLDLRSWFQNRPLWQPVLVLALLILLVSNVQLRQRLEDARQPAGFGTVTLTSPETSSAASGIIIISSDGQHGTLVVQDLPFLPETETYQLWLNKEGERISGPLFNVAEDGYRAVWVQAPEPLGSYETFGITIEPAGGSLGPTGSKVLGN